jgi:hypothetical protein
MSETETLEQKIKSVDDLETDEYNFLKEFYENNVVQKDLLPFNILINHFKFLKNLTPEEIEEYNQDSSKFFEKKGLKIDVNPYQKQEQTLKSEVVQFKDEEQAKIYWKYRDEGLKHNEAIEKLDNNQYELIEEFNKV